MTKLLYGTTALLGSAAHAKDAQHFLLNGLYITFFTALAVFLFLGVILYLERRLLNDPIQLPNWQAFRDWKLGPQQRAYLASIRSSR